jgi:hypothetical protein
MGGADAGERENTERTAVRTYVPAYQKEEWKNHAEDLGMSLSEFVRTMVQAGRSDFEVPDPQGMAAPDSESNQEREEPERSREPEGIDLERRLLETLSEDEFVTWDALVEEASADVEDHLYEVLERLLDRGRVRHDPRQGGYTLLER